LTSRHYSTKIVIVLYKNSIKIGLVGVNMNENQDLNQITVRAMITQREKLVKNAVDWQYAKQPKAWAAYKEIGYQKSLRDSNFHFSYLSEAIAVNDLSIFLDYVAWMKVFFGSHNFPINTVPEALHAMKFAIREILESDLTDLAIQFLDITLKHYPDMSKTIPSFLKVDEPQYELAKKYLDTLIAGERQMASKVILDAVDEGIAIKEIYLNVFQKTQLEVGRLWQIGQISVAQEHFCTATTQMVISQLYPYILSSKKSGYSLVATCVGDGLHEVGMRMVADFFEMSGWDTYFLDLILQLAVSLMQLKCVTQT
jgi:MerR family transcriptional regulator, light-induced transcriptional regulator